MVTNRRPSVWWRSQSLEAKMGTKTRWNAPSVKSNPCRICCAFFFWMILWKQFSDRSLDCNATSNQMQSRERSYCSTTSRAGSTSSLASPLNCIPLRGWYQWPVSHHHSGSAKFPIRQECGRRFATSLPANTAFNLRGDESVREGVWATHTEKDTDGSLPALPGAGGLNVALIQQWIIDPNESKLKLWWLVMPLRL